MGKQIAFYMTYADEQSFIAELRAHGDVVVSLNYFPKPDLEFSIRYHPLDRGLVTTQISPSITMTLIPKLSFASSPPVRRTLSIFLVPK